jgi:hypothetical protein
MKVRATQLGYYGHVRQKEGAVFELKKASHFSYRWMEPLDAEAEEAKAKKIAEHKEKGILHPDHEEEKPKKKKAKKEESPTPKKEKEGATGDQEVI